MNIKGNWEKEREREREREKLNGETENCNVTSLKRIPSFDKYSVGSNNFGTVSIINNLSKNLWSQEYVSTICYVQFVHVPLLIDMELHLEFC